MLSSPCPLSQVLPCLQLDLDMYATLARQHTLLQMQATQQRAPL